MTTSIKIKNKKVKQNSLSMDLTGRRKVCRGKRAWSERRRTKWRKERKGGWKVE